VLGGQQKNGKRKQGHSSCPMGHSERRQARRLEAEPSTEKRVPGCVVVRDATGNVFQFRCHMCKARNARFCVPLRPKTHGIMGFGFWYILETAMNDAVTMLMARGA